jgi:putative endonuclease
MGLLLALSTPYFVYILASQRQGTLYVGVTNNLVRRIHEHREKLIEGFASQHHVTRQVWVDQTGSVEEAITHEKRLKHWRREWKFELIEKSNPTWDDLYDRIL